MKKLLTSTFIVVFAVFTLCFGAFAAEMTTETTAHVLENKIVLHIEFSEALDNEFISVGLYDADGRLADYFIVPALYGNTSADIILDDDGNVRTAKIFAMADKTGLNPVSQAELVAIDRDGEDSGDVVLPEGVYNLQYQIVATPGYVFEADDTTADLGYDYDAVHFRYVGQELTDAPAEFYASFDSLGVEGEADDYIMSWFNLTLSLDDDGFVSEIYKAEPLMVKKTVTEMELGRVTTNTSNSYFDSSYTEKLLNGKVTFGEEFAYFYDAPYSYAEPFYEPGMTDEVKYDLRNSLNLRFISFNVCGDVEDGEHEIFVENVSWVGYADEYHKEDAVILANALEEVFVDGLYEADIYDIDGDGIYDYMFYKPYSAFFANTDPDYIFFEDGIYTRENKETAFTSEAITEGVAFEDGDYILGYFDKNANYIKIIDVIEPVEATVTAIKRSTGTITLSDGEKACVTDGWRKITNYGVSLPEFEYVADDVEWDEFDYLLDAGTLMEDSAYFYVYDGSLLYHEAIDHSLKADSSKLIIVTPDENGTYLESAMDTATGTKTTFVHVWMDGEVKWVPVDPDAGIYPDIVDDTEAYLDHIATYSVDEDGYYSITLLGYAHDEENEYAGITWVADMDPEYDMTNEEDDSIQAYNEYAEGYLFKRLENRFSIKETPLGVPLESFDYLITDETLIVIKNIYYDADDEEVVEFIELTSDDITATIEYKLENVQVVVENNVDYQNRENLVVLFATIEGESIKTDSSGVENNERIIKMMDVALNQDGKFYATYEVFNPYTGATVPVVGTTTSTSDSYVSPYKVGDVVEVNSNDEIEDASRAADTKSIVSTDNSAYYFVTGYSAAENTVELVKVPESVTNETFDETIECAVFITLDVSEAVVTMLGHQSKNLDSDMVKWGDIKVADVAKLDGSDKSYLAVNHNYQDKVDAAFKTVYGKYVKVYVDYDANTEVDIEETGIDGKANFIVVIANKGENIAYCDLD